MVDLVVPWEFVVSFLLVLMVTFILLASQRYSGEDASDMLFGFILMVLAVFTLWVSLHIMSNNLTVCFGG